MEQQPRCTEISLGRFGHAAAMLGPLVLQQLGRRAKADVVANSLPRQHAHRPAILRIIWSLCFGPEAMKNEAEVANCPGTLEAHRRVAFAPAAIFGAPAQCQNIARNRGAPDLIR